MTLFRRKKGLESTAEIHKQRARELAKKPRRHPAPATGDWTRPPSKRHGPMYRDREKDEKSLHLPSGRETEVLQLVALGLTNGEIGRELYVSEETIKTHMRNLLAKMGARNRAHLVTQGFLMGLLTATSLETSKSRLHSSRSR